ncbi:hypothetical protein YC2023_121848 [Brassica napus]
MAATTVDISAPEVEFFEIFKENVRSLKRGCNVCLWVPISLIAHDEDHSWSKFPTVTEHESEQVKGAIDFIGLIITRHFTVKDKSSSLKQDLHVFNIDKACAYTMETATSTVEAEGRVVKAFRGSPRYPSLNPHHTRFPQRVATGTFTFSLWRMVYQFFFLLQHFNKKSSLTKKPPRLKLLQAQVRILLLIMNHCLFLHIFLRKAKSHLLHRQA